MPKIEFAADLDLFCPIEWVRFEYGLILRRCQRNPLIMCMKSMVDNRGVHSNQTLSIGNQLMSAPASNRISHTSTKRFAELSRQNVYEFNTKLETNDTNFLLSHEI